MKRPNVQEFIQKAGAAKLLNLDMSLAEVAKSDAFGTLARWEEPWDVFCGNDFRVFVWPRRELESVTLNAQVAQSLRESLELAGTLKERLAKLPQ